MFGGLVASEAVALTGWGMSRVVERASKIVLLAPRARRYAVLLSGPLLVSMLSGCILGPDRLDLAVAIPGAYRAPHGAPYAAPPALDWWSAFRSRELTALIQEAQAANLDIAAATARITQADAAARVAGAALLPTVNLNGSATRSKSSSATGTGLTGLGGGGPSERDSYSASLSGSYEIDFWGKNRASSRAAEENAVAVRYAQDVVNVTTMAAVANAYFQVLTAQERLASARRNLSSSSRVLDLIRQRVDAGTASALETATQEGLVATIRAALPLLEQTLQQNRVALGVLVGQPPENVRVRGGSLYGLAVPRITPGVPADLLIQRPDIRQAEALLAAGQANVEVARAQMLPSISLTAQGGYQSALVSTLFTPDAAFYSIAAGLAAPIFDGFRLQGLLEQQQGRQIELLNLYRKAIVAGFGDVENALIAVQQSAARERLQRDVLDASRRAFGIVDSRLNEGTVDLITVLTTQQNLIQAEDNLAISRLARLQAVVSLFQALGGGWTPAPLTRSAKLQ